MRILKYIVFFLVLAYAGKSCSLSGYKYCEIAIGKKCILEAKDFSQDSQNEVPKFKKKYKTRGIQVIVPQISVLVFYTFNHHKEYTPHVVKATCSLLQFCANAKRGPPSV